MIAVNSDIEKFNQHGKGQLDLLSTHGTQMQDLLTSLFKGYKDTSNREFWAYIAKKEDKYNEGTDIEPNHLMKLALNKYKMLIISKRWNAQTMKDSRIVALEDKIKRLHNKKRNKLFFLHPKTQRSQTATKVHDSYACGASCYEG